MTVMVGYGKDKNNDVDGIINMEDTKKEWQKIDSVPASSSSMPIPIHPAQACKTTIDEEGSSDNKTQLCSNRKIITNLGMGMKIIL